MAIEVEKMVAVLEARIDQFEKNMAKALGTTGTTMDAITARGKKLETDLAIIGARGGKSFDGLSKAAKGTQIQTGNLAAQLQDIGVQLAGGQSPFLIALQQGGQITQAFGNTGVRGAMTGVAAAAASLISPISLITIGAIAGGGALLQMFSGASNEAPKSEEALKSFDELVKEIGRSSKEAADNITKMINAPVSSASLAADQEAEARKLKQAYDEATSSIAEDMVELTLKYSRLPVTVDVRQAREGIADIGRDLRDGKISAEQAEQALAQMSLANTFPESLNSTVDKLREGVLVAVELGKRMAALSTLGFENLDGSAIKGGRVDQFTALDAKVESYRKSADLLKRLGSFDTQKMLDDLTSQSKSLHPDVGKAAKTDAEKHAEAVREVIDSLAREQAQIGMTSTEIRVMNELRKAGAAYLSEEGMAIAEKVRALEAEKEAIAKIKEQQTDLLNLEKDIASGGLTDIRRALEDGKISWNEWGDIASNAINKVADKLQDQLIDAAFSSGGTGLLSWLFGGLGGVAGGQTGGGLGSLAGAGTARVPQLASVPAMRPALQSVAAASGGSRDGHVTIGLVKDGLNIRPEVVEVSGAVMRGGLEQYRKTGLKADIAKANADRRAR